MSNDAIIATFLDGRNDVTDLYYGTTIRIELSELYDEEGNIQYWIVEQDVPVYFNTDYNECMQVNSSSSVACDMICNWGALYEAGQVVGKRQTMAIIAPGQDPDLYKSGLDSVGDMVRWIVRNFNFENLSSRTVSATKMYQKPDILKFDENIVQPLAEGAGKIVGSGFSLAKTVVIGGAIIIGGMVLLRVLNFFKK